MLYILCKINDYLYVSGSRKFDKRKKAVYK